MQDKESHNRFENKIISIHPEFLNILRDLHPLAFLSSFSLLIATFITKDELEIVQEYAILASLCFLIAFIASFMAKIIKTIIFSSLSIATTVLGIIFLFLIIIEFIKSISMANRILPPLFLIIYILILVLYYNYAIKEILNTLDDYENRKKAVFLFITLLNLGIGVIILTFLVLVISCLVFIGKNPNYQLLFIFIITSFISYAYYRIYINNKIKFSKKITFLFQYALIVCAGFTFVSWFGLISIYLNYFIFANLILFFLILSFIILGNLYCLIKNNNV